ncbi:unnamed protein product [Aphanomyces euteiches]|uniref:Peptidase A1 domain-containing protein n=1 Tax=Aphanomyces euteiches TaxID=100861 RepID=A0A6G0W8V8_9STRA|nr:hypothetical protein Ae201684_018036 [Aphanomyces euteiches]KAH9072471.1 hypothetical protein Ae201684P_022049 [Aphanomyces euteiches]KAH9146166.1 hypothetical protein AeRB84_009977 [Aphanomyces euteiches]
MKTSQRSIALLSLVFVAVLSFERVEVPLVRRSLAVSGSVDLVNKKATQFLAPISIDGRSFSVLVDTGSSDLWISCSDIAPAKCINITTCPTGLKTIVYGSGNVCLEANTAKFTLGSLEIPNLLYSVGVKSTILTDGNQGILGLAFPSISTYATSNISTSYPIQYLDSFSMYLTAKENQAGSKLVLNGVDDQLISSNNMVGYKFPLNETEHWTIQISQFLVENDSNYSKPCSSSNCLAIVDSGTTFLSMPSIIFKKFAATYLKPGVDGGCTYNTDYGYYVCPKDIPLPKITLTMGTDKKFVLNSWDYSWVYSEKEIAVQIQKNPASGSLADRWILGDTFLKIYYTTYHIKDKAITFYCKNGGVCAGGENVLDFSGKTMTWAVILMIAGGSLLGLGLVGCLVYWYFRRRNQVVTEIKSPETPIL